MPGDAQAKRKSPETAFLVIDGVPEAVRDGLAALFAHPVLAGVSDESLGSVEIVLAEVMNNIVEHAYAQYPGKIDLTVTAEARRLSAELVDSGLPMPGGQLPGGKLGEIGEIQDLPEGGFGWFLIRSLTEDLTYHRDEGLNITRFCIPVDSLA